MNWTVVESDLLGGERILLVHDRQYLKDARAAEPGLVVYLPSEIEQLYAVRDNTKLVRNLHAAKKHLGGWILPARKEGAPHAERERIPA